MSVKYIISTFLRRSIQQRQPVKKSSHAHNSITRQSLQPNEVGVYSEEEEEVSSLSKYKIFFSSPQMSSTRNSQGLFSQNRNHKRFQMTELLDHWTSRFHTEGIPDAASSAEYIIAHVLGKKTLHNVDKNHIHLNQEHVNSITKLCTLRLERMPVPYIIGEWDFYDLTLKMKAPVFRPRPETEELVGHCIQTLETWSDCNQQMTILELCCGSGAISLSLLKHFKQMQSICVDISPEACALTKANAKVVGVEDRLQVFNEDFTRSGVLSHMQTFGPFCLLVSNPPYVTTQEMETLPPEILRYEDHVALHGGSDGLDIVRHILHHAGQLLMPQGHVYLEVGEEHPDVVEDYVTKNMDIRLEYTETIIDMFGKNRFCHLRQPAR